MTRYESLIEQKNFYEDEGRRTEDPAKKAIFAGLAADYENRAKNLTVKEAMENE